VQAFDEISGPNTDVLEGEAVRVNADRKEVLLADGRAVPYDKLCICTGARPRQVSRPPHHPHSLAKRFSNP
jgi:NADPH-dependent 2,4-dienoyl-CoA reductase/sulfur reductase-like enzyme